MPILVKPIRKKQSAKAAAGVWVDVCCIDPTSQAPFAVGWHLWNEDDPIAKYIPKEQVARLKIAQAQNVNHRRYVRDQARVHGKKIRAGKLSVDQQDEIEIWGIAETILLDWEGFSTLEDPADPESAVIPLEYTSEFGFNMLMNERSFLDLVSDVAQDETLFEDEADTVKN